MLQKVKVSKDSWFGQLVRFTGVGAIGTAVDYAIYIPMVLFMPAFIATGISASFGALVNYILNYKFTFDSEKSHKDALPKFMAVAVIAILLNMLIMYILDDLLNVHPYLAKLMATVMVLAVTFTGSKLWAFKQ